MNILFVSGHPAQVHNFRLVREELIKRGHNVFWLTTKKDIATNLLETYGIPFTQLEKANQGMMSKIKAMLHNVKLSYRFLKDNKIDIVVSRTNPFVLPATFVLRIPHLLVSDTEHASAAPIMRYIFNKMGDCALVPSCFWYTMHKKQYEWAGNIEMYYCHPNRFHYKAPWELLGLAPDTQFAIVRFVKWDAYHDTKLVGGFTLDQKRDLVRRLAAHMRVFISSETELPQDLEPYRIKIPIERMHDVQAAASLFVGESATMASESVVLGTPAVYIDEVGRGYTDEEAREDLLYMFRPVPNKESLLPNEKEWIKGGVEECIETAEMLASPTYDREAWKHRHEAWMQTKIDPTAWLTWLIENYPQSVEEYRTNRAEVETRFK